MAGKRANGEGSIYRAGKRWKVVVSLPPGPNGERRRKTGTAKSRAEAIEVLDQLRSEIQQAPAVDMTVGAYLSTWLATAVKRETARTTQASYGYAVRNQITPYLGAIPLAKLAPLDIEGFLSATERDGVPSRTRQYAFTVLRAALNYAVKTLRLIPYNPCLGFKRPKHEPEEVFPFTAEEALKIIEATADTRYHAMHVLGFTLGPRQGELFGLERQYLDLKAGTVRIEWQAVDLSGHVTKERPKQGSVRKLELPPIATDALRQHQAIMLREGHAKSPLVFPAPEGGYITRGNFRTRHWLPLLKRLGIAPRGYHHVRHTYATLALGEGVPVHVVSRILGHSRPSTTLDIYAHAVKPQQSAATKAIGKLFRVATPLPPLAGGESS